MSAMPPSDLPEPVASPEMQRKGPKPKAYRLVRPVRRRDPEIGEMVTTMEPTGGVLITGIHQLHNPVRRAKRATGLSGRQLKKALKAERRARRAVAREAKS